MTLFNGLSAFPITPTDAHGIVDTDGVARLVTRLADAGVDSVGLLGSTGIYAYLTRSERRRAIHAAAEAIGGRTPLMVGVGALRTDDAQDLARDAEAAGADALLMAPVSYTPLTQAEAFAHYAAVAGSTGLPLCVYNNPGTTHFTFGDALLDRLVGVPTIVAIKMPLPTTIPIAADLRALRERPTSAWAIGYSGDWGMAEAMLAGADAFYSVLAGILAEPAMALVAAAKRGDRDAVARIDGRLEPLWAMFREFGGLRVAYAALDTLGLCHAEPPRPILPVGDDDRRRITQALAAI